MHLNLDWPAQLAPRYFGWFVVCSLLVMVLPAMMLSMSGDMLHLQLTDMGWHLTLIGAVKGLFAWCIMAGAAAWLLATIYNRLQSGEIRKKE